jgi:ABC-type hemin transport system substrate-binding protein
LEGKRKAHSKQKINRAIRDLAREHAKDLAPQRSELSGRSLEETDEDVDEEIHRVKVLRVFSLVGGRERLGGRGRGGEHLLGATFELL